MFVVASTMTTSLDFQLTDNEPASMSLFVASDYPEHGIIDITGSNSLVFGLVAKSRGTIILTDDDGEETSLSEGSFFLRKLAEASLSFGTEHDKMLLVSLPQSVRNNHEIIKGKLSSQAAHAGRPTVGGCNQSIISAPTGDPEYLTISLFYPTQSQDWISANGGMVMVVLSGTCLINHSDSGEIKQYQMEAGSVAVVDAAEAFQFAFASQNCELVILRRGEMFDSCGSAVPHGDLPTAGHVRAF